MSKGFAIEFSTVTYFSDDGDQYNSVHRFRVLVVNETITAYVAYVGPFGENWARIVGDEAKASRADISSCTWPAPFHEHRVIALAFDGYVRAALLQMPQWVPIPDDLSLINIGTVTREA